jgi:hypothetical protein
MLGKVIAADDQGKGVVEVTGHGYFNVEHCERRALKVGEHLGGRFDKQQELEIEIQPLDRRHPPFKLLKLTLWPDAEQALNDLRSNSTSAKLQIDGMKFRHAASKRIFPPRVRMGVNSDKPK